MRKGIWLAAIFTVFTAVQFAAAQQASQSAQTPQSSSDKQTAAPTKTVQAPAASQATATKKESLGEAARKAREAQKNAPKAATVFTNDNMPVSGSVVSVVGSEAASGSEQSSTAGAASGSGSNDEAAWRKRFADARHKIQQDEEEISLAQRELSELQVQYYPDPSKALAQSVSREDIIKKSDAITAKQKQLDSDKQALSNLEDELRKSGGDPGWARE